MVIALRVKSSLIHVQATDPRAYCGLNPDSPETIPAWYYDEVSAVESIQQTTLNTVSYVTNFVDYITYSLVSGRPSPVQRD